MLTKSVETPARTITLVRDGQAEPVRTRALTVEDFFAEQNIARRPEDAIDVDPASALTDGEVIHYRAAVPVTIVVDDVPQAVRTTADSIGELLNHQQIAFDVHDRVVPGPAVAITPETIVHVDHVSSWIEKVRKPVAPPIHHLASFQLALGATKIVAAGTPGVREVAYLVTRGSDRTVPVNRSLVASRIVCAPHPRVIAAGVGEYASLASLAMRGFSGTIKLARAAMSMVATAYTANCYGCSGLTASGQHAGHGIVAVDPHVIPLGTHLYIPGYGHALAGDTGGAIQGNRIDLGFNSHSDAMQFGRRDVMVYVLHK